MTCSNIGADVIGNSKTNSYEKSSSGSKRSKSQESADSDKINANSTDSNHSPASNHSYSDSHHLQYHHQIHQRSPPSMSNGKSSGQISFKPYEDVSSAKKSSVMSSSDQLKCDKNSKDRFSPNTRSSSSSSTTKTRTSEASMNRSSSSSSTVTNNTSSTSSSSSSSNVTKSHNESHHTTTPYNAAMESELLKSSGHLTAAYASLVSQHLKSSQQVCRDPFCTGCQMSSPYSAPGHSCCNGLSACIHQNPFASYASALGLGNPMASHLMAASRYQNGLAPGMGRPYVCSWTAGGSYCGKNFSTSDELLQHLKSHTSSSNYVGNNPMSGHSMSQLGHYPHMDPMLTSPVAGLRRTAFDPVNRFHPYKPFGLPLTQLGSTFNPSLSSLPPHHHHQHSAAAAAAAGLNPWRESLR